MVRKGFFVLPLVVLLVIGLLAGMIGSPGRLALVSAAQAQGEKTPALPDNNVTVQPPTLTGSGGGDRLPAAALLNADGTLNLQTGASGSVDLAGWRVSLDPRRGPVFAPDVSTPADWSALGSGLNDFVNAIAVSGSDVYVGGRFTQICGNAACNSGNITVNHVAHWNGSAWSALGNGVNDDVDVLAMSGNDVYVGGAFTLICSSAACNGGDTTANYIAHWNGSGWSALYYGVNSSVFALVVSGSDVYVGGDFIQVCGYLCLIANNTVNHVAMWNGSAWYTLGSGVNNDVYALAVSGSDVYAGGAFTQICGDYLCSSDNEFAYHIAKWSSTASAWSALYYGVNLDVDAIAVSGSDVYVGGAFTLVCGVACLVNTTVNHIAHWNGSTWSALGNGVNGGVSALAVSGSDVYVGGEFTQICGNAACDSDYLDVAFIAKWSSATSTWSALGNRVNNRVYVLTVSGSDVYVGGLFDQVCGNAACDSGNTTVNHVAKFASSNLFLPLIMR